MNRKLDTDEAVFFYEQEFYVLSNFSAFNLIWKGHTFPTSEAAYHWEKFPAHPELRRMVKDAPSAHESFKLAQQYASLRREDWNAVKVGIMRGILLEKVRQHPYVRQKLLETGGRKLVEDSWRDSYWGEGEDKQGRNMLGNLWMEVREMVRK